MTLTATEQFAIDSMAKLIQKDWENIIKVAQTDSDTAYERIAREGKEHQDEGFIQQSVERIQDIKRAVSVGRSIKNQRLDDLRKVTAMLGGNKI